jgi:uncharacterized delta-60 repeat protein
VLDNGQIVGAGNLTTVADDRMVLAYLFKTDGSLAPFAGSNWLEFQLGYNYEITKSSFVLPDGRILLGGTYYNAFPDVFFFVICLHPDGTLDTSFGVDGIAAQPGLLFSPNSMDVYYKLGGAFDIFLCGNSTESGYNPAIVKLDQYGQMVNTFGNDGIYTMTEINGIFSDIYAYSFSGSGYLLLGGNNSNEDNVFISKHDPATGELVDSFGTDGIYLLVPPEGEEPGIQALVFHTTFSNNTVTAFGDIIHPEGDIDLFAIRLDASDGTPDPAFGVNGWSSLRAAGTHESMRDAILQHDDGKYYFGARSGLVGEYDFMLGRLSNNGFLDPAFGDNGITTTHIDNADYLWSLALSPDESRLYAAGNSISSTSEHPSVACYYTGVGVGISDPELNDSEISVYPNPVKDVIHINTGSDGNYLIKIFSLDGKLIEQKRLRGKDLQMNINHLEKGMYFLNLSNDNFNHTKKIIKQ